MYDGGPASNQHWRKVLCLLGIAGIQPECHEHIPTNTIHRNNVGLMLGQRRRRWTNIKPILFKCVVFAGYWLVDKPFPANTRRSPNVGSMLAQH